MSISSCLMSIHLQQSDARPVHNSQLRGFYQPHVQNKSALTNGALFTVVDHFDLKSSSLTVPSKNRSYLAIPFTLLLKAHHFHHVAFCDSSLFFLHENCGVDIRNEGVIRELIQHMRWMEQVEFLRSVFASPSENRRLSP